MARNVYITSFVDYTTGEDGTLAVFGSKSKAQTSAIMWLHKRWNKYPLTELTGWTTNLGGEFEIRSKEDFDPAYDFVVRVTKMEVQ